MHPSPTAPPNIALRLAAITLVSLWGCARSGLPSPLPEDPMGEVPPIEDPPRPEDPVVEACDPRGAGFDFDGDGVPLICDDLVELPAALAEVDDSTGFAPETVLEAAGDTVAVMVRCPVFGAFAPDFVSGCEARPLLVIDGNERAALFDGVLADGAADVMLEADVSSDRQVWIRSTNQSVGDSPQRWWRVFAGELGTPYDESSAVLNVQPTPSGGVLAHHQFEDGSQSLDLWQEDATTPLETGAAEISVEAIGDALHVVAQRDDGSASLTVLRSGMVLADVLTGSGSGRVSPVLHLESGTGTSRWYCAATERGVSLSRVVDGEVVAGDEVSVPGAAGCGDVRLNGRIEDALWLTTLTPGWDLAGARVEGQLYRRPNTPGAELELLVDGYNWSPIGWSVSGGHVIAGNQPSSWFEFDVFVHSHEGGTRTLIADAEPGTRVLVRGDAIGTVGRLPYSFGAPEPVEIIVRVVRDGVVRREILPTLDSDGSSVFASYLSPEA